MCRLRQRIRPRNIVRLRGLKARASHRVACDRIGRFSNALSETNFFRVSESRRCAGRPRNVWRLRSPWPSSYEQGRRNRARDRGIRNEQDPAARSPLGSRGWKIIYPEKRRLESEKEKPESKTRSGF